MRPSTQGADLNFLTISSKNSLEFSTFKKCNESARNSFLKENFPARLSIFAEKKINNDIKNEKKEIEFNNVEKKNENKEFLQRFHILMKQNKKTADNVENKTFREKIKNRIKTAYITNSKNEVNFVMKQNDLREIEKEKEKRMKIKRFLKMRNSQTNKTLSPEMNLQYPFKSQIIEKEWTGELLKAYKKKLRANMRNIKKELFIS